MNTKAYSKIFKALADVTRLEVTKIIAKTKEISCQELQQQFDLSQPTLSHHFRKLIDAEIIAVRKDGTAHFYSLNPELKSNFGIDLRKIL